MKNTIKNNRNIIGLLGVHVSFFTLDVFISTFLVAELYTLTSFSSVALFNLILLSSLFLTYFIISHFINKISRILILRFAVIVNIIVIGLIILLFNDLEKYYLILGFINGISMGMYWVSMHSIAGDIIPKDKIPSYMIYSQISFALAKIIFPLTLGALIDFIDFQISAWFTIFSGILVILFTFFLLEQKRESNTFSLKKYFKVMHFSDLKKPVFLNYLIQFIYGAYSNSINLSITVLIIIVYKNNFSLGIFSSIFSFLSILFLALYRFLIKDKLKNKLFHIAPFLIIILTVGLLFEITQLTMLLFIGSYLVFSSLVRSESDSIRLNLTKILKQENLIAESNSVIEFVYWLARLVSLGSLMLLTLNNIKLLPYFILFMTIITFISAVLINKWYKKYNQKEIE